MTTWAQNTFSGYGTGASYNPYLVSSVEHLIQLANDVNNGNSYEGKYFELTAVPSPAMWNLVLMFTIARWLKP